MLAVGERVLKDLGGGVLAADELHHDVDVGVAGDIAPVAREGVAGQAELRRTAGVERAAACYLDIDAVRIEVAVPMLLDEAYGAPAHGAESDDADMYGANCLLQGALLCARRPPSARDPRLYA